MRSHVICAIVVLGTSSAVKAQDRPPIAEFREWSKANAHAIPDPDSAQCSKLAPVVDMVGDARVVALTEPAFPALLAVLSYLDRVDPALAARTRDAFRPVLPQFDVRRFVTLSAPEQNAVSGQVHDLAALVRRERIRFTAASSRDDYEWALRQAVNAEQDDAFMHLIPRDFFTQLDNGGLDSIRLSPEVRSNLAARTLFDSR